MSDSTAEIKGAAARLAAAMPSGGKRLTMEFGTVVGVHDTALDVMLARGGGDGPDGALLHGVHHHRPRRDSVAGPLAVCVGTMAAV